MKVAIFWFRRDLRLHDNVGLTQALMAGLPVIPIFIFDKNILNELPADDPRVNFIYDQLEKIHIELKSKGSGLSVFHGNPDEVWNNLLDDYDVAQVYVNRDYEPYAKQRDQHIETLVQNHGAEFKEYKDQVIFEEDEITKDDGLPYTVFTPYMKKWKAKYKTLKAEKELIPNFDRFYPGNFEFPSRAQLGIKLSDIKVWPIDLNNLSKYADQRNFPRIKTTDIGPHLRFGTVSIRRIFNEVFSQSDQYANELIWREFFMQILYHFPESVKENFKSKYDHIQWRNDEAEFEKWCKGETGFPIVDAGMRQLNETGYMHGRVRMITASFLIKHLLIDWRWGEAYFAQKLLDFELSSNVGNWQWVAGTGCDAAPYFRIFNPLEQQKKFDPKGEYIRTWVKNLDELSYPAPMVDHKFARERCLTTFKEGLVQMG